MPQGYYPPPIPFAPPVPPGYGRGHQQTPHEELPDDEQIQEMIEESLDWDPLIPYGADIEVGVDAGEVTLSGNVPNKRAKHAAGNDAFWAPGVVDVKNELVIEKKGRRGKNESQDAA
ncbi:MAG: BON domain-containing protein [Candidatus Aquicultor sp.]